MKEFSLQLYSLRDIPTLRERVRIAAEAGYTGVEFAGYEQYSAAELKALLAEFGLKAVGSHVSIEALRSDLSGEIAYAKEVGMETVACPYIEMSTYEQAAEAAAYLETCALQFAEAGIPFGYHNHNHEFAQTDDGRYLLEVLMEKAPHVQMELDVFWAKYAGVDPLAFIEKHSGRFFLLHFKEIAENKDNVELGRGIQDFAALAKTGFAQGTRHIVVEQEGYTMPPAESVTVDAAYMKAL